MPDDIQKKIEQWEKMSRQAPDDMAYFSLGSAYREAGRLEEADGALAKSIEYNPNMSRAYQLRGQILIKLDKKQEAGNLLKQGYTTAAKLGDVMPQRAMGSLLEKLGEELPQVETKTQETQTDLNEDDGDTLIDRRTGQRQKRLPDPPMRGAVGQFIYENFGQETWRTWIGQGTKVINEFHLDFSNDEDQKTYERYMMEWLQISPLEIQDK